MLFKSRTFGTSWELICRKTIIKKRLNIDSLKIVIEKLENDLHYIEKVAREKYNMIKEGETVYQIVPGKE